MVNLVFSEGTLMKRQYSRLCKAYVDTSILQSNPNLPQETIDRLTMDMSEFESALNTAFSNSPTMTVAETNLYKDSQTSDESPLYRIDVKIANDKTDYAGWEDTFYFSVLISLTKKNTFKNYTIIGGDRMEESKSITDVANSIQRMAFMKRQRGNLYG